MNDLHLLDFHDDLLGRYLLATEVLPILKKYGYTTIGLEGFVFGSSLEEFKSLLRSEIEETRMMLCDLGLDRIGQQCAFGHAEYRPTANFFSIISQLIYSELILGDKIRVTVESLAYQKLLGYVQSSLINRSTLHLIEQLEKLGFECVPIENPTTSSQLVENMKDTPREMLSEEIIDSYNEAREHYFNQKYQEIKQSKKAPIILFTGIFHWRAIQSTEITRLSIVSDHAKVPDDFKTNKRIKILDCSAVDFQIGLRRILDRDIFSIRHFCSEKPLNYMRYFQPSDLEPQSADVTCLRP